MRSRIVWGVRLRPLDARTTFRPAKARNCGLFSVITSGTRDAANRETFDYETVSLLTTAYIWKPVAAIRSKRTNNNDRRLRITNRESQHHEIDS
jgi:hypothetical protein